MPGNEFFARMGPEFAQQVGSAHENATRQADVGRLIAKAEYEYYQLRRGLVGVMEGTEAEPLEAEATLPEAAGEAAFAEPAKAA